MAQSKEFPQYKWVPPKSWTKGRVSADYPDVIFIHTTEGSEGRESAENGAAYDSRRTDQTSTHFFVDQDSTIQCVYTKDEAHAARTHGNDKGIQIEVCGKAGQTKAQWTDAASAGAIEQCARLGVAIRKKYGKARFPLVNLTPAELRAGKNGFAEHYDATKAWPGDGGTHTDPGPNFPWSKLFARITELEGASTGGGEKPNKMIQLDGTIPELRKGQNDPVPGTSTYYITRAQRQMEITDDGDYGTGTAAAVKKLMANDPKRTTTDGSKIGEAEWRRLYGLWG
jgi:hypothetical protein